MRLSPLAQAFLLPLVMSASACSSRTRDDVVATVPPEAESVSKGQAAFRKVEISLRSDAVTGGYFVVPGSRVDVIRAAGDHKAGETTKLSSVLVLAIDGLGCSLHMTDEEMRARIYTYTLFMTPEQAQKLTEMRKSGSIRLAVRAETGPSEQEKQALPEVCPRDPPPVP